MTCSRVLPSRAETRREEVVELETRVGKHANPNPRLSMDILQSNGPSPACTCAKGYGGRSNFDFDAEATVLGDQQCRASAYFAELPVMRRAGLVSECLWRGQHGLR